jgi:hypothetical protein
MVAVNLTRLNSTDVDFHELQSYYSVQYVFLWWCSGTSKAVIKMNNHNITINFSANIYQKVTQAMFKKRKIHDRPS